MNAKTEVEVLVEQQADEAAEIADSIHLSLGDLDMVAGGTIVNTWG